MIKNDLPNPNFINVKLAQISQFRTLIEGTLCIITLKEQIPILKPSGKSQFNSST